MEKNASANWTDIIQPKTSLLNIPIKEVWRYRDLLLMLVKRDFVSYYKQTILGPVWFFVQPILTTLMFVIIFGNIAKISTDELPKFLFYLSGITLWNYFSDCLNKTATVFKDNANLMGKVYFPRLILPLSIVTSNLIKLGIQLLLFFFIWMYFLVTTATIQPNFYALLLPFIILIIGLQALGFGMIISSLTNKYRDLIFLLSFAVQLWMYATPIIYPMSAIPEKYKWLINFNPVTPLIEIFRYGFLGKGEFSFISISYCIVFTILILSIGTIIFNKVEKNFMDTV